MSDSKNQWVTFEGEEVRHGLWSEENDDGDEAVDDAQGEEG